MKTTRIIAALAVILLCAGFAASAAAAKPVIKADTKTFDIATGMYILKGNVAVEVGGRTITAGEAKVSILSREVWGMGGITLTQQDTCFSGDTVYVNGPADEARIGGGVMFRRGNLVVTADDAEFNWRTKQGVFRNNVRVDDGGNVSQADVVYYDVLTNAYRME